MSLSLYQTSVPCFIRMLTSLDAILVKAEAQATAKKIDPAVLLNSRLFPDMFALMRQIQIATDHAKGAVSRLAGVEVPKYEDNEQTLEEIRARLAKTIGYVGSFTADQIDSHENDTITLKVGGREMSFSGQDYLVGFALPNFYFHVVTAYNILRHNGIEIGKRDYMGA